MYTDHRTIIEKEPVTASGVCNLAGAVLLRQHKAVYMLPSVACNWAGAAMLKNSKKAIA